jgi:hypothetical protein
MLVSLTVCYSVECTQTWKTSQLASSVGGNITDLEQQTGMVVTNAGKRRGYLVKY